MYCLKGLSQYSATLTNSLQTVRDCIVFFKQKEEMFGHQNSPFFRQKLCNSFGLCLCLAIFFFITSIFWLMQFYVLFFHQCHRTNEIRQPKIALAKKSTLGSRLMQILANPNFSRSQKLHIGENPLYNLMVTLSSNSHKAWVELVQP